MLHDIRCKYRQHTCPLYRHNILHNSGVSHALAHASVRRTVSISARCTVNICVRCTVNASVRCTVDICVRRTVNIYVHCTSTNMSFVSPTRPSIVPSTYMPVEYTDVNVRCTVNICPLHRQHICLLYGQHICPLYINIYLAHVRCTNSYVNGTVNTYVRCTVNTKDTSVVPSAYTLVVPPTHPSTARSATSKTPSTHLPGSPNWRHLHR